MISYIKNLILHSPTKLISYADYIDAALYHPKYGYYMREKVKIGRTGDFITTSNLSDFYGKMVAKWFAYICRKNQLPAVFCEIGAGNGRFAYAFLTEWYQTVNLPLTYMIVESSPYHRTLQSELLTPDFSVIQVDRLDKLDRFEGMVFSNELFDALPVHVIEKENGRMVEVMVGMENDQLYEKKVPLTNPDIHTFLQKSKLSLREKQRLEVPLAMEKILHDLSQVLTKGLVVTADYGYTNDEWMEPSRVLGSLRGYYQHKMMTNVLLHPGKMDITSHIHFDWLMKIGEELEMQSLIKQRQDEFLLTVGILKELETHYDPNPFSEVSKRNRAIRSLIMPSSMSSFFHILIQQKGLTLQSNDIFEQ